LPAAPEVVLRAVDGVATLLVDAVVRDGVDTLVNPGEICW
jgi:hypothetical protein